MCSYRYVYYSDCQHSELVQTAYCARARALGLPQRDDCYRHDAGAISQPIRHSGSALHSSLSFAERHLATQHHNMSTSIPSESGAAFALSEAAQHQHPMSDISWRPQPAQETYTADPAQDTSNCNNLNIAIPLDVQASLSMELMHDGKVTELVARFEAFAVHDDSDASQVHNHERSRTCSSSTVRPYDVKADRTQNLPTEEVEVFSSPLSEREIHSPRKPIPSQWKSTLPRAPKFETERRKEEREKRKATQGSSPVSKTLHRARSCAEMKKPRPSGVTYLTKDTVDTVSGDITSISPSTSPKRLHRLSLKNTSQSSKDSTGQHSHTQQSIVKINLSPTKASRPNSGGHGSSDSWGSTGDTVFHSARHSPVSPTRSRIMSTACSPASFQTAYEPMDDEVTTLDLACADGSDQASTTTEEIWTQNKSGTNSRIATHPKSLNNSSGRAPVRIKPAVPNLSLQIPCSKTSVSDRKPPFIVGSASSSSSVATSPTRQSRIPRVSTVDTVIKAAEVKKPQVINPQMGADGDSRNKNVKSIINVDSPSEATETVPNSLTLAPVRRVRTVNSSNTTPIIGQRNTEDKPDVHAMVTSYLEHVEPSIQPDHMPFTQDHRPEMDFPNTVSVMLSKSTSLNGSKQSDKELESPPSEAATHGSLRAASTSTVKAPVPNDPILEDPAIIYRGRRTNSQGSSINENQSVSSKFRSQDFDNVEHSGGLSHEDSVGHNQNVLPDRPQPKSSFEMRATAPEFVPQVQFGPQFAPQFIPGPQWIPPPFPNLSPDPWAIDGYGIPFFYYIYPVPVKQAFKSPRKYKTLPRRKRGDSAVGSSPRKAFRLDESPEAPLVKDPDTSKENSGPFSKQLEEVARSAAMRKKTNNTSPPQPQQEYHTMPPIRRTVRPPRNVGNGLYDTYNRGRSVGVPIDDTAPFPDPVPPLGHTQYVDYTIEESDLNGGCGYVNIKSAAEWGGSKCNSCSKAGI